MNDETETASGDQETALKNRMVSFEDETGLLCMLLLTG